MLFLDGNGPVLSLQQAKEEEQYQLENKRKTKKYTSICVPIACLILIAGIIILITTSHCETVTDSDGNETSKCSDTAVIAWIIVFVGVCAFCCGCGCFLNSLNRGYLNGVYAYKEREALQFNIQDQMVRKIVFSANYGFNRKAKSQQQRDSSLHEPIIEIKSVTQTICGFNRISAIGKEEVKHGGSEDGWTEQLLCIYFDPVLVHRESIRYNFDSVYQDMRRVMQNVDPTWLSKINDQYKR